VMVMVMVMVVVQPRSRADYAYVIREFKYSGQKSVICLAKLFIVTVEHSIFTRCLYLPNLGKTKLRCISRL